MSEPTPIDRRAILSWALYDFANSPFTTLVVTFIYATYFTQVLATDPIHGTALWSRGMTVTALTVAVTSPFLGALADRGGFRKLFLAISTSICIVATISLFFIGPGAALEALIVLVIANIAYEVGGVFYNAFLPDIAPPDRIGRVSGFGWGLGYVGGLVALLVALVSLVQPEQPWFGFSRDGGENVRATLLLVAGWFAVFSVPIFLWVREDRSQASPAGQVLIDTGRQFKSTFGEIRKYRQIGRFLMARLIYNDGLVTIFAFGGIYAAGTFGFTVEEILIFGIVLNVTAGLGAFAMGFLDDRMGAKRTLQVSLVCLTVAAIIAVAAPNRFWFWVGGVMVGVFAGPNQAASRSLMGRFVPPDKETEFFGFFAFSGKLTAFMGPLLFGILTQWSGTQRAGVAAVIGFFLLGLVLLARIDENEGVRAAGR